MINLLSERRKELLKLIVEEYIKTANPVGSSLLCDKLNCSSATIRNEMASLEDMGYLEKTHTSSGRVPSEMGYRYYVDNLMEPKKMTGEEVLKLQTIFDNKGLVLSDVITRSMEIISEITNCTALVVGASSAENKLKEVETIPFSDSKVIAIVITDKGHVEHKELNVGKVSPNEVKKVVELINKLLVGTPLDEVSAKLEFEIKPIIGNYVKSHEALYQAFYNAFNEFSYKSHMHMAGRTKLLDYREFDSVAKVKEILNKAKTDTANFIEQLLSDYDWGSKESYASLLPEIADIMSISTSTLKKQPPLVQLRLEMAYAHFWFSDKRTIYDVLSSILKNYL